MEHSRHEISEAVVLFVIQGTKKGDLVSRLEGEIYPHML